MKNPYEDIIDLPRHRSKKHPSMPRQNRAAQFSPFAALVGHDEAVREAARTTDRRVKLDEYIRSDLNRKLIFIKKSLKDKPQVTLVYFKEDKLKDGGSYIKTKAYVKNIDEYKKSLVLEDGREILINDIVKIHCI